MSPRLLATRTAATATATDRLLTGSTPHDLRVRPGPVPLRGEPGPSASKIVARRHTTRSACPGRGRPQDHPRPAGGGLRGRNVGIDLPNPPLGEDGRTPGAAGSGGADPP